MSQRYAVTICLVLGHLVHAGETAPAGLARPADLPAPIIFIGNACAGHLAEHKDRNAWSTVASRVGMFVHSMNINRNSNQAPIMATVAPLFGQRRANIEHDSLPMTWSCGST